MKFRFVCKHWSVYFCFQCLFTFFWLFVLVSNVYLHFFDVNKHYFQKFPKISNRNFENFEISLCLQTLVCLFWFPMFIYIFLIVCFGSQCLFTFFLCKHTLFSKIFENLQSEFRVLRLTIDRIYFSRDDKLHFSHAYHLIIRTASTPRFLYLSRLELTTSTILEVVYVTTRKLVWWFRRSLLFTGGRNHAGRVNSETSVIGKLRKIIPGARARARCL